MNLCVQVSLIAIIVEMYITYAYCIDVYAAF